MGVTSIPDVLDAFAERGSPKELVVLNRTEPDPVQRLLEKAFDGQVSVSERTLPEGGDDVVVLVEGGTVTATSPLSSVMNSFLLINSDMYRSSVKGIDAYRLPDVLAGLDGAVFRLRGYPATNKGKLLLIAVSRYIEALALRAGAGRLDAAFQRLSRLDDELGTRRVYERLGDSGVEVHTYGASGADWVRENGPAVNVHTGDAPHYRRSWFVVFSPAEGRDARSAALVAWEVGANEWRSTWTYDPGWVTRIQRYVVESF